MRRLQWLGVLLLSSSWLYFIPQFTILDAPVGFLFFTLGVLCMVAGEVKRRQPAMSDRKYYLLFIPLLLSLLVIPYPYNLGVIVLLLGLSFSLLCFVFHKPQNSAWGVILAGVVLLFQTAVFPFYVIFISHGHRIDLLSPLVSWMGTVLGFPTSTAGGIVFIQTIQHTVAITTTWEKLGIFVWLNIFIGALLLFSLRGTKRVFLQSTLVFLLISVVYLILRYIAIISWYLSVNDLSVFWDPLIMTLSFLPFSLLLIKLLPLKKIESENTASSLRLTHQQVVPLLVGFLMIFSVVGACTFQDPGTEKNGRVLIDEYHSQWEDTQRPLDTEWYGLLSTYNYYSWAQWLTTYYDVARNTDRTLTPELLRNYDILILKCPTQSYSPEEIRSIGDFVRDGGGLYLIGDHTNVFGMNSFLNQVSEQFGFRFNTDATYELGTGNLSTYNPDPLVAHAVLRHVHQFEFMTSCTIEPTSLLSSATMENIIIGDRVTSEPGTYATENFFRESVGSPDSSFGYLLQAAAMKYGQGRVVGFTDSTVFSSFSVFTDGYPAFTLGAMTYLNRTNTYAWVNLLCIALAVISAVGLIVLLRSTKKLTALWVLLFSGALAASGALPFFSTLTSISYPLPAEQTMPFNVSFEQQHSSIEIIVKPTGFLGSTDNKYGTFYVWTQRVGCVPSIENTLTDAITHGNVIVFINPTQTFTDDDIQMVTGYLEHGGRVLLMDSITNQKSTANELLGSYGVWISPTTTTHTIYGANSTSDVNASVGALVTPYFSISGGTQLLLDSQNTTMASIVEVSNQTTGELGKLVVLVDSYSFCDTVMGNTFTEPTDQQHRLYDTEFFLFSQVLKL